MKWLRTYWLVPLMAIGGALLWFFRITKEKPKQTWKIEAKAAKAAADAREVKIRSGADVARARVRALYQKELKALNEEQKAHATKLSNNPVALSKFLVRVSERS